MDVVKQVCMIVIVSFIGCILYIFFQCVLKKDKKPKSIDNKEDP
jgi:hypothetical protein